MVAYLGTSAPARFLNQNDASATILDILAQDLRYAARGFVRSPTFTLVAVSPWRSERARARPSSA